MEAICNGLKSSRQRHYFSILIYLSYHWFIDFFYYLFIYSFIQNLIGVLGNCLEDRCYVNGLLKKGNFLTSKNGKLKLILQEDGNLEILCGGHSIWSTNTYNFAIEELHFSREGKLLILNKDKSIAKNIMSSSDNTNGAEKLILQDDGNLVIYNNDNQPLWSTGTHGKCVTSKNGTFFERLIYIQS